MKVECYSVKWNGGGKMTFWKHENEISAYTPLNHDYTYNRKMTTKEDNIQNVEVIIGEMERGGKAEPHSHEEIEQIMYILEGKMGVEIGMEKSVLTKGYTVIIPKKTTHEIWNAGNYKLKFVLTYSPIKNPT